MRLNVWSPLPPARDGIADYVAEQLPWLARRFDVRAVVEDPEAVDPERIGGVELVTPGEAEGGLDLYHLGNSPAHAYVYRAARARPGVSVLHEWSLHHLVLHETVERGDVSTYLREMRRAHGAMGTFVARQVARGLGGAILPSLLPLNDRIFERSLGLVALSRAIAGRARSRMPGRPVLALPLHFSTPLLPPPSRAEARRALGLRADALIVTAPGLGTAAKRLDLAVRVVAQMRERHRDLRLIVAGEVEPGLGLGPLAEARGLGDALLVTGRLSLPDFVRHLAAADVVLALRFPSHGEMSAALVRALGLGRAALVTAGTPAAREFPEGLVVPITPGPWEDIELERFLHRLFSDPDLRERIGELSRAHVLEYHDLGRTVGALADFLEQVDAKKASLEAGLQGSNEDEDTLEAYFREEVGWGARDLGLVGWPLRPEDILCDPGLGPQRL